MFVEFGYYKEFYIGNQFIGTVDCDKDREIFGHFGAQKEITETNLILKLSRIRSLRDLNPAFTMPNRRGWVVEKLKEKYILALSVSIPLKIEIINTNANQLNLNLNLK